MSAATLLTPCHGAAPAGNRFEFVAAGILRPRTARNAVARRTAVRRLTRQDRDLDDPLLADFQRADMDGRRAEVRVIRIDVAAIDRAAVAADHFKVQHLAGLATITDEAAVAAIRFGISQHRHSRPSQLANRIPDGDRFVQLGLACVAVLHRLQLLDEHLALGGDLRLDPRANLIRLLIERLQKSRGCRWQIVSDNLWRNGRFIDDSL